MGVSQSMRRTGSLKAICCVVRGMWQLAGAGGAGTSVSCALAGLRCSARSSLGSCASAGVRGRSLRDSSSVGAGLLSSDSSSVSRCDVIAWVVLNESRGGAAFVDRVLRVGRAVRGAAATPSCDSSVSLTVDASVMAVDAFSPVCSLFGSCASAGVGDHCS